MTVASDGFTIGEVLNQLKEDFEDITISKIRFLESEGLIYPARTESGYRKFTDDDVDRLRFILTAQRDHYLPLKIIREQLERLDAGDAPPAASGPATGNSESVTRQRGEAARALDATTADGSLMLDRPPAQASLSLPEFCDQTGLRPAEVKALGDFGIISARGADGGPFDADDLLVARAARDLVRSGLEARHLRMYRQFVDRELALFEQLVVPLLRQRNPEARRQATEQLERLATLTSQLQRALLTRALRGYVHGS